MNHYPHHIGDFAKKTKGLSLTEKGAYRELLDQYYANEAPLPLDRREIYRMAVAATPAERKAVDYVLGKYFVERTDGYHQKRANEEIELYRKRKKAGASGANSRWQSDSKPDGKTIANGIAEGCGSDSISMPTRTNISDEVRSEPQAEARSRAQGSHRNGFKNQTLATSIAWMTDDNAAVAKARELGFEANRGEGYPQLRQRIAQTIAERERQRT